MSVRERVLKRLRREGACGDGVEAVMALHSNTLRALERHVEAGDFVKFLKLARKAGIEEYAGWAVGRVLRGQGGALSGVRTEGAVFC